MNYRQESPPGTSQENSQEKRKKHKQLNEKERWLLILILFSAVLLLYFMKAESDTKSRAANAPRDMMEIVEAEMLMPTPSPEPTPEPTPRPAFVPSALQELDNFASAQGGHVSVWLRDLETGETYYHDDGGYYCASTLKAPYALWLCLKDEKGEIDLDTALKGGTGWELLHQMVAQSSNSATRTLSASWRGDSQNDFGTFLRELGFSSVEGCEVSLDGIHGWLTAEDGGLAMQAIYDYIKTDTENAQKLKKAFLDADHDILWSPAPAAKKYGSWDKAFHDMMIVYGDKPYILSVFTDWGDEKVNFPQTSVAMMQQMGKLAAAAIGAEQSK